MIGSPNFLTGADTFSLLTIIFIPVAKLSAGKVGYKQICKMKSFT
ncbi:hypothetical protein LBBP_00117 [Leptospira borgpetersenii serovar Ballum]|uniref:Uncharacterized protein n=1 Tax=Leptospira borgpetersenii serovar Ballum TaxID=280505 RepID=A0A0S2ILK7_LEPBO|nr:hypothetical protein LBBP_00117 [Leptospira borgpetersenii serovar Ballum]